MQTDLLLVIIVLSVVLIGVGHMVNRFSEKAFRKSATK